MLNKLIIALIITISASSAHARATGCGPSASFNVNTSDNGSSNNNNFTSDNDSLSAGFTLRWTFGHKEACEASNAADLRKVNADTAKINAEATEKVAKTLKAQEDAIITEAKAIKEKIGICKDFTHDTAPKSIVLFCGDLLGIVSDISGSKY